MTETGDDLVLLYQERLRAALGRYRASGDLEALGDAFGLARATVLALGPEREEIAAEPAVLLGTVPAIAELAEVGAGAAATAAQGALSALWSSLLLQSAPPAWTATELASARSAIVLAVSRENPEALAEMRTTLRRIGAGRVASLLVEALTSSGEAPWRRILGGRYESLVHRCAPRKGSRRGLGGALAGDRRAREAMARQLAEWLRRGAAPDELAPLVEGVVVHYRTPTQLA